MRIKQETCGTCNGEGKYINWIPKPEEPGIAVKKMVPCKACNEKGYIEYAVFSIEEANAIFEFCGLEK